MAFDQFLSQTNSLPQLEANKVLLNGAASALSQKFNQTYTNMNRWLDTHVAT
jgi:hypothetical protein